MVFTKLAEELDIGLATLYRTVQFYETYPENFATWRKLTWSHFRVLVTVKDDEKRNKFEEKIVKNNLTVKELEALVKKEKSVSGKLENPEQSTLPVTRGIPYVYRIKALKHNKDRFVIDCGFKFYVERPENKVKTESVVRAEKMNSRYLLKKADDISPSLLYTYKAYVVEVIDGDTLWLELDLGFNCWSLQKIRLRGINTAGIDMEAGRKAREFIVKKLSSCGFVVVKSYYRDKFTRYLGDIFYNKKGADVFEVAESGVFLNKELLGNGLASKYRP